MILELAEIRIDPAHADPFAAAVAEAEPLFRASAGCTGFALTRTHEDPALYRLVIGWTSVEAHMVDFRESPAFATWRGLVAPFFAAPPVVTHLVPAVGTITVA